MLFNSLAFVAGFLPLCLLGAYGLARWRQDAVLLFLLLASLGFYAWWRWDFLPLLLGSILGNFLLGERIRHAAQTRTRQNRLIAGIAANLLLLGWFKYAGFLAGIVGLPSPSVFLPLAISFFTFQQIMYLRHCRDHPGQQARLLPYALFVAFFPHLIAGPIVRPAEILPQMTAPGFGRYDPQRLADGLTVFLLGLGKKLVLADGFAHYANPGFDAAAAGASLSLIEAWCATLAYGLQIYFDFSGYSDMAIGLAGLFGVRFPRNFDSPYQAATITDFWRRWHISLSTFLRDHVYIPLGGNRGGEARRLANLMLTMLLGGLWHGAAWNFVLWGGLHGGFLAMHRLWRRHARFALPRGCAHGLTLLAVLLAWVPFRADGVTACMAMLRGMAGLNGVLLPRMIVDSFPLLGTIATPVPALLFLGDGRTLALPEALGCLGIGWAIVLWLPQLHGYGERSRLFAVAASFAFTVQALVFAPHVAPFLYFRF